VRLVDEEQEIGGHVIKQSGRRFSRQAAGKMARIIFDAVAEADGAHHFDIEQRALHHALRLDDLSLALEFALPPVELFVDGLNGALFLLGGQHVVRLRVNGQAVDVAIARADFAGERVDLADGFDLAAPHFHAHGEIVVGGIDLDHVAADAERAAAQVLGAIVLNLDELAQHGFARDGLPLFEHQHHAVIGFRRADTVNAGNRCDDDHVTPLEEGARGAHAELVELVVDRGFFFDEGVAGRDVGFRLVVIVVADEVFHGVLREERFELVEKLRGEGLVVGEDDGRAVDLLDHLGHGEGLARAGDAEQHLMAVAVGDAPDELGDGFRLVAARFVVTG
jgi:hypothetical protein